MDCDGYPRIPMPLMCTAFVPGQIDAAVAGISDPNSRAIATAEALYFRGQATLAAKTARPYLDATDSALRYSACFICGYASLSLNRIADARRCLAGILDTPTDEESPAVHATHILFASAASVLLHLSSPYSAEEFYPLAAHLPEGLRLFASYVMAHALYLRGEYGRSLGMAENALIMKQGSYPISELFLHLAASMACMSLKDIDAAKTHFGVAWNIARPDGLIELIGEHHGLLQGLIEACLKTQYPDDFARIIEITYRFSYGWRRIHNPDSGEDVADDLTTTEFTMAMLACRGWTNAEIARHMGVSPGTVKTPIRRIRKAWHRHTRRAGRAYVTLATGLPSASNAFRNPALRSINLDILTLERHYRYGAPSRKDSNAPLTAAAAALAAAGAGLVAYSTRRTALETDTANEVNSDRPR